jgi:hypothetical protein
VVLLDFKLALGDGIGKDLVLCFWDNLVVFNIKTNGGDIVKRRVDLYKGKIGEGK